MWGWLFACKTQVQPVLAPIEQNEELSGGQGTIFDQGPNAYAFSFRNLTRTERRAFAVGNALFNDNWVTAPASTAGRDGLGPLFNAHSCSSCHFKDGRAAPPREGINTPGLLLRLRIGDDPNPIPDSNYGFQLQDNAILNVHPEGQIHIEWEDIRGHFQDGTPYTLTKPTYSIVNLQYGELHSDIRIGPRIALGVYGNGLLEAISEETLHQLADPEDLNQDGISGKINVINGKVGRFGWKASVPSIVEQTAEAFLGDLGITSPLHQEHAFSATQQELSGLENGGAPEVDSAKLNRIAQYVQLLAVPARRDWTDERIRRGKQVFWEAQCAACHIPTLHTGDQHPVEALNNQIIHPYTDLLLHDMGEDLADHFSVYEADGKEWRTPPLWGIGLLQTVNGHSYLLHDGRARNTTEAILWHGGEAAASRQIFLDMNGKDREDLLHFLSSL